MEERVVGLHRDGPAEPLHGPVVFAELIGDAAQAVQRFHAIRLRLQQAVVILAGAVEVAGLLIGLGGRKAGGGRFHERLSLFCGERCGVSPPV